MSQKKVDHAGDWTKPGPSVWQSEMLSTAWKLGKMSRYPREWPFPPARYLRVRIVERSPMAMALRAQAEKWRTRHIFVFTNGLHAEWTIGLWCKRCPLHYKNGTHLKLEELRSSYFLEKEIFSVQIEVRFKLSFAWDGTCDKTRFNFRLEWRQVTLYSWYSHLWASWILL